MIPLDGYTKDHLLIDFLFVWELKLLLLPAKGHFRKSDDFIKDFYFYNIIMPVLKSQRLTIKILISIRIAPSICIHQISRVSNISVVIKLILVLLYRISKHYTQKDPRTHIKSVQFNEYFTLSLSDIGEVRPLHFFVSCLHYSVGNSIQVLTGINPKDILCFYLSCLGDRIFCLFVVLLCNNLQFLCSLMEIMLLGLEFVSCSVQFICQLFMLISNSVVSP